MSGADKVRAQTAQVQIMMLATGDHQLSEYLEELGQQWHRVGPNRRGLSRAMTLSDL